MLDDKKSFRASSIPLSSVIGVSSALSSDSLRCNFREVQQIDKLPGAISAVKNLDLAHNSLQSLQGIEQFTGLKSVILDYNLLDDVTELNRIHPKSSLTHLSLVGNPISLHPNLIPSILSLCPK